MANLPISPTEQLASTAATLRMPTAHIQISQTIADSAVSSRPLWQLGVLSQRLLHRWLRCSVIVCLVHVCTRAFVCVLFSACCCCRLTAIESVCLSVRWALGAACWPGFNAPLYVPHYVSLHQLVAGCLVGFVFSRSHRQLQIQCNFVRFDDQSVKSGK